MGRSSSSSPTSPTANLRRSPLAVPTSFSFKAKASPKPQHKTIQCVCACVSKRGGGREGGGSCTIHQEGTNFQPTPHEASAALTETPPDYQDEQNLVYTDIQNNNGNIQLLYCWRRPCLTNNCRAQGPGHTHTHTHERLDR